MVVTITLTTAGADTGPFNIYSDVDGYISAFETGVPKASLLLGYTSYVAPNGTAFVRVMSDGQCKNYIDIPVYPCTTTTTTTVACASYDILGGVGALIGFLVFINLFTVPSSVASKNPSILSGFIAIFIFFAFIIFIYACFKKREG